MRLLQRSSSRRIPQHRNLAATPLALFSCSPGSSLLRPNLLCAIGPIHQVSTASFKETVVALRLSMQKNISNAEGE
jgi:hypothetical protein